MKNIIQLSTKKRCCRCNKKQCKHKKCFLCIGCHWRYEAEKFESFWNKEIKKEKQIIFKKSAQKEKTCLM